MRTSWLNASVTVEFSATERLPTVGSQLSSTSSGRSLVCTSSGPSTAAALPLP